MTLIMGVVNASPDSFSGDGFDDPHAAVSHGFDLVRDGADLLDIGAESTRPGFTPVPAAAQINRLVPVLEGLAGSGVPLSADTMSAEVANAAIGAGVAFINDVSGGLADADMLPLIARCEVDYICGWWTGWPQHELGDDLNAHPPITTSSRPLWRRTIDELLWRRDALLDAGVPAGRIVLDPGLGFGKSAGDNWQILAHLDAITALGHRVLIGASRKRFVDHSDIATATITSWCAQHDVWAVRVHDVAANRQTIAVMDKLTSGDAA